jgi:hypothetical protein
MIVPEILPAKPGDKGGKRLEKLQYHQVLRCPPDRPTDITPHRLQKLTKGYAENASFFRIGAKIDRFLCAFNRMMC